MDIGPYRSADEAQVLEVWRAAMTADAISEPLFRIKVLPTRIFCADLEVVEPAT